MTDPNVSPLLKEPLRELCRCGRGPKRAETEICRHCEDDAQAAAWIADDSQDNTESVVDLDVADIKAWGG